MPFANKFRAMMEIPLPQDTVGAFVVETVDVRDQSRDWRGYSYAVRIVVRGPGGKAGLGRALAPLFAKRLTTFSSYGNPYQLWFGRPEIVSLGERHYEVLVEGAGARTDLQAELERFLDHLEKNGHLAAGSQGKVVDAYLDDYRGAVKRKVDRSRRLVKKQRERGSEV